MAVSASPATRAVRLLGRLAAVLLLSWGASRAALGEEQIVVLGTAPVAGVYYPAGGALCRLINKHRDDLELRCLVESTNGSAENLERLESGDLDFALLQSDWQFHAFQGSGLMGKDEPFNDLRALFSLHAQPLTIVVARESGIDKLADLRGKRVNLGPNGTAVRSVSEMLIQSLGWKGRDFAEVMDLGLDQQVQALCAGLIDAFILPTSHPNGLIAAATEGCLAKLVEVDGRAVDGLVSDWPYFSAAAIPGGIYRGNPELTRSFGVRATLVTHAGQPTEVVYNLVRGIFEQLDELKRQHPAFAQLTAEQMVDTANTAPLHEGALLYYKERGWK